MIRFILIMISLIAAVSGRAATEYNVKPVASYVPNCFENLGSAPRYFIPFQEKIFFVGDYQNGTAMGWTDGQTADWYKLPDGGPAWSEPWDGYWTPPNQHLPERLEDRLLFFNRNEHGRTLWQLPANADQPQAVKTFPAEAVVKTATHGSGLVILVFQEDTTEIHYFDGHNTSLFSTRPGADPQSFHWVKHQGLTFFTLGSTAAGYDLWRADGSQTGTMILTELPQTTVENEPNPGLYQGTALFSVEDELVLFMDMGPRPRHTRMLRINPETGALVETASAEGTLHQAGLSEPFMVDGALHFVNGDKGLTRFQGKELMSFESIIENINVLSPHQFTPADGGFYFVGGLFNQSEAPEFRHNLYWYDDDTQTITRLMGQFERDIDSLRILSDGRLGFRLINAGYASTGHPESIWISNGTHLGTRAIGPYGHPEFEIIDTHVFFSLDTPHLGAEPHMLIDEQPKFLADLQNQVGIFYRTDGVSTISGNKSIHLAVTEQGYQIVQAEGDAVTSHALDGIQPDVLYQVDDTVYLIAEDRSELYRMEPDGPQLITDHPAVGDISRIIHVNDQTLVTGLDDSFFDRKDPYGLSVESHLVKLTDQGPEILRFRPWLPDKTFEIQALADGFLFTDHLEEGLNLFFHQNGQSIPMLQLGSEFGRVDTVNFLGEVDGTLFVAIKQFEASWYQPPQDIGTQIYAVTTAGAALRWEGHAQHVRLLNDRPVFQVENQLQALNGTAVEVLFQAEEPPNLLQGTPEKGIFVYYSAGQIWISDGTREGTRPVTSDLYPMIHVATVGGIHYFLNDQVPYRPYINLHRLYQLDGATGDITRVENTPLLNRHRTMALVHKGDLYVAGHTSDHGEEIWRVVEGRAERITDIQPGPIATWLISLKATPKGLYAEVPAKGRAGVTLYQITEVEAPDPPDNPDPDQPDDNDPEPPPTLEMQAPETMKPYQIGIARLIDLPNGATVTWHIEGGRMIWKPQRDAILFKAGDVEELTIHAEITHPDGRAWISVHHTQIIKEVD